MRFTELVKAAGSLLQLAPLLCAVGSQESINCDPESLVREGNDPVGQYCLGHDASHGSCSAKYWKKPQKAD
jgi:hypothetical protein